MSSINPRANTTAAHANSGRYFDRKIKGGINNSAAIRIKEKAENMATPPKRGVGLVCHRSDRGSATCPFRMAKRLTNGVSAVDRPKARMNAVMR